jgi:hypothetical protein
VLVNGHVNAGIDRLIRRDVEAARCERPSVNAAPRTSRLDSILDQYPALVKDDRDFDEGNL